MYIQLSYTMANWNTFLLDIISTLFFFSSQYLERKSAHLSSKFDKFDMKNVLDINERSIKIMK